MAAVQRCSTESRSLDPNLHDSFESKDAEDREDNSSSSYVLAEDQSQFSRDIEHWMNGSQLPPPTSPLSTSPTEHAGVQGTRNPLVQRSVLARSFCLENTGIWYLLAMVMPLFSISSNSSPWRCTPSLVVNSVELLMAQLARLCGRVQNQIRRLSHDHLSREIFATVMDVILVIYAVGFLILSLYQASIFV